MLKRKVVVELSDESKEALSALDEDVKALVALVGEVAERMSLVLETVRGDLSEEGEVGVEVFQRDEEESRVTGDTAKPNGAWGGMEIPNNPETELRATPYTRAPRQVQVDWLVEVMGDGGWYSNTSLAKAYATDEKHLRYMRGALTNRMREMMEDGILERRDSHTKGAMYEYRLRQT